MVRKKPADAPDEKKTSDEEMTGTAAENVQTAASDASVVVSAEEYDKLKAEFDTQKDQFLRMAAEYDNFRKRTEKEKLATFDNAVATIIEAFIPVADNFALALASSADADDEFRRGLEMIAKQLDNAFRQLHVEEFGERGEEFDPQLHNAVTRVDDPELPEDHIAEVYQKGYRIGDKIIRHAMVQVSN